MNPGSYALRFRGVDKKYLEELGDAHLEERSDLLARSRRLSADTAKRRKALALKRKLEAQKEEKRRQEILQKRREQIREATEKYQRGNKNYSAKDYESYDRHKTPTLEEALSVVRGRTGSANRTSYRSYSAAMATGGVAQVRVSSAGSVQSTRSVSSTGSNKPHSAHYNYTGNKGVGRDRSQTQLHTHSLRNLNNSRSLFEQQLQHHQQLLIEQQKQSLHQFNAAIQMEMDQDPKLQGVEQTDDPDIRPNSPDSIDSLEVTDDRDVKPANGVTMETKTTVVKDSTNHAPDVHPPQNNTIQKVYSQKIAPNLTVVSSSYVHHGLGSSQSPVAVVQPQVKQCTVEPVAEKPEDKPTSHNETKASEPLTVINAKSNDQTNGTFIQNAVVGCAGNVQPCDISTAIKENIPIYQETGHEFSTSVKTKAWVSPSPVIEQERNGLSGAAAPCPKASNGFQDVRHTEIGPYAADVTSANTNAMPAHQKAVPLPVSTTAPVQQRPAPSTAVNTMSYFTVPQQNAAGARPLPVTSVVISSAGITIQQPSYVTANTTTAPAMDKLKQYCQFPMYRVANAPETDDQNSHVSETSTLSSDSGVAKESQPEPETQQVRGILKKVSSYGPPLPNQNALNLGRGHVLTRSMSAHTGLRDSLEITKIKKDYPAKRPKSVRFADVVYNDDSDSDKSQPERKVSTLSAKPPASGLQGTRPTRNTSKIPRASSAGTESRKPFLCPHPPNHPPTGRAVVCRNNQKKAADISERPTTQVIGNKTNVPAATAQNDATTATKTDSEIVKSQPVYDINGVRLDRTPTDEEINYLWDKVRTCLSRQSNSSTVDSGMARSATAQVVVAQKNIDGSSLAPQCRAVTRVNSTYTNNYMGTTTVTNTQARKKVSMDVLNNFARRQSLLNQRNKQNATKSVTASGQIPVSMTTHLINPTSNNYQTSNSTAVGVLPHQTSTQPVSESLAAFLAAEDLAKDSVSDSQIEAAMDRAVKEQQIINTENPQPRVPTALSIEEQRLMQSLERLNERLRLNETQMYPVSYTPNPPPYHAGFRGHHPIASSSMAKRQANSNGTVPRHAYRSGSAPVQRTTNYAGPYRYR